MSEYMEKHTVSRLIGAPPGYVGYEEGGQLTEAVRRKPYSVILFDEIEKAHPDVFNVLLQILDDGRLTDAQGRTVDFKNTVIIMTSNIGSQHLLEGVDAGRRDHASGARRGDGASCAGTSAPSSSTASTTSCSSSRSTLEEIEQIVDLLIEDLRRRLAERAHHARADRGGARASSRAQGYDPVYGARPLKRFLQRELETPHRPRPHRRRGPRGGDAAGRRQGRPARRRDREPRGDSGDGLSERPFLSTSRARPRPGFLFLGSAGRSARGPQREKGAHVAAIPGIRIAEGRDEHLVLDPDAIAVRGGRGDKRGEERHPVSRGERDAVQAEQRSEIAGRRRAALPAARAGVEDRPRPHRRRGPRGGQGSKGLMTSTPQSAKSRTLRVATAWPWTQAIAAIWPSRAASGRPIFRRRPITSP